LSFDSEEASVDVSDEIEVYFYAGMPRPGRGVASWIDIYAEKAAKPQERCSTLIENSPG